MSMFFPELAELFRRRSDDFKVGLSNFQSFCLNFLQIFFFEGLFIDDKIAFSLVIPHVGWVNTVIFKESLLDISEGDSLFLIDRDVVDDPESK